MDFKVREISSVPEKSVAEKEQQVLSEATQESVVDAVDNSIANTETQNDLREEDVLSYINKRYNKAINSFDDLVAERQESEPLPEDVAAYLKYKKDTGRGIQDFLKVQEDFDEIDSDKLLKRYFLETEEGIDEEDADAILEEYAYDEDLDDPSDVKKAKLKKKKIIAKAKSYFTEQKEKYKIPLESSRSSVPDSEREEYESYKQYMQQSKTLQEENERKRQWFSKKTDEVFGQEFKGFEFQINDKKLTFTPGSASELKNLQSNPSNFIMKYLDENGLIKDAVGYHKALSIAMNPEKFARFFYEQGMSDATEDVTKKIKNINMSERNAPQVMSKGGVQIREVNPSSGRGLKIKSAKRM
jgi:hypothetical protein